MADEMLGLCSVTSVILSTCTANAGKRKKLPPLQRAFVQQVEDIITKNAALDAGITL